MNHVGQPILTHFAKRSTTSGRRGFSVLELLVVAAVLVLLLGIAVTVISSVTYSSERSLAENQLRVGMTAARDAAIRSRGGDAAAVFYFREGRTVIQPCVRVGELPPDPNEGIARVWDDNLSADPPLPYEVFVPVPEVEPIVMPRNWTVRGFAPAGSLHTDLPDRRHGWYEWIDESDTTNQLAQTGLWVFPETDFLPRDDQGLIDAPEMQHQGWRRQSFCVRFKAQTGEVIFGDTKPFLVLDAQEAPYRYDNSTPFYAFDVEQQEDTSMAVTRALATGGKQRLSLLLSPLGPDEAIQTLLGNRSTDMILVRPIHTVSLTDERRLASAIGLRGLNRDTASMYRRIELNGPAQQFPLDDSLATFSPGPGGSLEAEMMTRIARYITSAPDTWGETVSLEARVYTMSRYAGQLQSVNPGEEAEAPPSTARIAGIR